MRYNLHKDQDGSKGDQGSGLKLIALGYKWDLLLGCKIGLEIMNGWTQYLFSSCGSGSCYLRIQEKKNIMPLVSLSSKYQIDHYIYNTKTFRKG